jgi:hypothetical protein
MAATPGGGGTSPAPNPADIVYGQYLASGIVFAKANEANLATALTTNAAADSLTEVFNPVTLATGKITSASTSSTSVTGTSTAFLTDFVAGDYMFYYTADGNPVLLGKVAVVNSDTSITLSANAAVAIGATPGAYCGKTNMVIGVAENILVRIPVVPASSTQIWMPNWNAYRITSGQPTSFNKVASSYMETYSEVNNPIEESASPVNIPYTITPIYNYTKVANANGYQYVFLTSSLFPNYVYAVLNPNGNSQTNNLAPNTLFKMFANESFFQNGIKVTTTYPFLFLQTAGY